MAKNNQIFKSYIGPIILISSTILGGLTGFLLGPKALILKPFGDILLNLIFTIIVPLIFFSVSSAITKTGSMEQLRIIIVNMTFVFLFTGIVASLYALFFVKLIPPADGIYVHLSMPAQETKLNFSEQIAGIFTVPEFSSLLTHKHILSLIVFSILVGLATVKANEKGKEFARFLDSGTEVFLRIFSLIMYYAPIGFFAYFAVLVSEMGPQLMESYVRITILYYVTGITYFLFVYTGYAYLAGKLNGIKLFWKNISLPMITAIATCSSAASIPANLIATQKMNIPPKIYETTVPLGSIIHKDGSVIGGVFKIAFLFGMFHMDISGANVISTILAVSLLVGTVMGAIPSGGMLGELLILNIYGFPASALIAVAAISVLIDPLATMLNVTGNSVSSMLIARLVEGKKWYSTISAKLIEKEEILFE